MIIKLNSGIVGKGIAFEPNDLVDWQDHKEAERLIEKGLATKATDAEVKAAAQNVKRYVAPKSRPEDKWPPSPLKNLPKEDAA